MPPKRPLAVASSHINIDDAEERVSTTKVFVQLSFVLTEETDCRGQGK